MLAGSGRPRTACNPCKRQKVRCSGERPACRRCARLRHHCGYVNGVATTPESSQPAASYLQKSDRCNYLSPTSLVQEPLEDNSLGIPKPLIAALVDTYYSHIYNATLLLHRKAFQRALAAGTADPAVVLSVCAFASIFHHKGTLLREHGFSNEWAERAGKIAFQNVETPTQNNVVVFLNLALFWYSQGSWRRSYVHKANAFQSTHILGLGRERRRNDKSFETELRRRRFWACYLTNCHAADSAFSCFSGETTNDLSLPWREEDFEKCQPSRPPVSLSSGETNGGMYCEVIRALTLWSSVYSLIKTPELNTTARVSAIHSLDAEITKWWKTVSTDLKVSPDSINQRAHHPATFPKLLLISVVYHQCLCALHASIVPLFSWSSDNNAWMMARQFSAQVAFEHACAVSDLLDSVFANSLDETGLPSFVAYAAYCSCAIQIPFLRSTNTILRERMQHNIARNIRLIQTMGRYWRFSNLLEIHVQYLHTMHSKNPTTLENEPRHLEASKLRGFRVTALHARQSILGHNGILWAKGEGCAEPGEEVYDLGVQDETSHDLSNMSFPATLEGTPPPTPSSSWPQPQTSLDEEAQQSLLVPNPGDLDAPMQQDESLAQETDFFYPFLDPENVDALLGEELPNFDAFTSGAFGLGGFVRLSGSESGMDTGGTSNST